jgi:RNA 2',3'-cyclic 3'-phosphodiesterase
MSARKSHHAAVVVIPPEEICEPIQAIRRLHDRLFLRWMPHINLLYPFLTADQLANALPALRDACTGVSSFAVSLASFRFFGHSSGQFTVWLDPQPCESLVHLQAVLQAVFPECDDLSRFRDGFTPHLSVGQARSRRILEELLQELQPRWQPLHFVLDRIAVVRREEDTPFHVEQWVPLTTTESAAAEQTGL